MATTKTITPGITLRDGTRGVSVRFACMISGQRFTKTCDLPFEVLVDRGRPTNILKVEYNKWVAECGQQVNAGSGVGLRVPTIAELIEIYEEIAWKRNQDPDWQKPTARSIETAILNYRHCVEASGLRDTEKITRLLDPDMIRRIFAKLRERMNGVSAFSYVQALRSVTAKWTIIEYRDRGFEVRAPLMPDFGKAARPPEYRRLTPEMVQRIERWYCELATNAGSDVVLAATIIYQLAVRPNDIGRLTRDNFPMGENGHRRLTYMPAKTRESSNRRIDIEIPDALYELIKELSGERWDSGQRLLSCWRYTFVKLNTSMRIACGMQGWNKAAYELRKLCVDTVMRTQGIDQAVKLSGDRRETIEKYYSDPYKADVPVRLTAPIVSRGGGSDGGSDGAVAGAEHNEG